MIIYTEIAEFTKGNEDTKSTNDDTKNANSNPPISYNPNVPNINGQYMVNSKSINPVQINRNMSIDDMKMQSLPPEVPMVNVGGNTPNPNFTEDHQRYSSKEKNFGVEGFNEKDYTYEGQNIANNGNRVDNKAHIQQTNESYVNYGGFTYEEKNDDSNKHNGFNENHSNIQNVNVAIPMTANSPPGINMIDSKYPTMSGDV